MARKIDLDGLKRRAMSDIGQSLARVDRLITAKCDLYLLRWVSAMTAVELHGTWERYVEDRLVAALNHDPKHFIADRDIKGVKNISSGLAFYIVRGGGKFFDFRSTADLLKKADGWLGATNPFRKLDADDRAYIDVLAAVRNCIVHGSDASWTSYRRALRDVYRITYAPSPDEFLNAIDSRPKSPARYKARLKGISEVLDRAIRKT